MPVENGHPAKEHERDDADRRPERDGHGPAEGASNPARLPSSGRGI
jgi:hypothetical protein